MVTQKNPPEWRYKFQCAGCFAELIAEFFDIKFNGDGRKYLNCIWCGTTHWLGLETVPIGVELRARHRLSTLNHQSNVETETKTFIMLQHKN